MRELATEGIGHADRAGGARVDEGAALEGLGQDVVDEHAPVHEIDSRALRGQRTVGEYELPRIADDRGDTRRAEGVAQDLELGPGRHLPPVDNRHRRRPRGAAGLVVAGQEGLEERVDDLVEPHLPHGTEAAHGGRRVEELTETLRIADAGRRFGVVLGKVDGVRQEERVEARGRAGRRVPGIDVDERVLGLGHAELVVDVVGLERRADHALAQERDRLGRHPDAGFVSSGQKERPEKWTMDALTEGQLLRAHRCGERGREPRRQFFVRPE